MSDCEETESDPTRQLPARRSSTSALVMDPITNGEDCSEPGVRQRSSSTGKAGDMDGKRKRDLSPPSDEVAPETSEVSDQIPPSNSQEAGPLAKRRKSAKSENGHNNDIYCWVCHKEVVLGQQQTSFCKTCPRTFHSRCIITTNIDSSETTEQSWACPECMAIERAENVLYRSPAMQLLTLDQFCTLLKFSIARMKIVIGAEPFLKPVDTAEFPRYSEYVVHPMDLSQLERNIRRKQYGSTEAFLADTKWILHNSIIFNTCQTKLTGAARLIVKACRQEMAEIETCPDCYLNAHTRKESWFTDVCRTPHLLVWAKLKGYPYWPAKAMKVNKESAVDVRFFGAHDKAWVPVKDCFLYSKEMPAGTKQKKKNKMENCLEEAEQHTVRLKERFGAFSHAPPRTPFDPDQHDKQLNMLLPNYRPGVDGKRARTILHPEISSPSSSNRTPSKTLSPVVKVTEKMVAVTITRSGRVCLVPRHKPVVALKKEIKTEVKETNDDDDDNKCPPQTNNDNKCPEESNDDSKCHEESNDDSKCSEETNDDSKCLEENNDDSKCPDETNDDSKCPEETNDNSKCSEETNDDSKCPEDESSVINCPEEQDISAIIEATKVLEESLENESQDSKTENDLNAEEESKPEVDTGSNDEDQSVEMSQNSDENVEDREENSETLAESSEGEAEETSETADEEIVAEVSGVKSSDDESAAVSDSPEENVDETESPPEAPEEPDQNSQNSEDSSESNKVLLKSNDKCDEESSVENSDKVDVVVGKNGEIKVVGQNGETKEAVQKSETKDGGLKSETKNTSENVETKASLQEALQHSKSKMDYMKQLTLRVKTDDDTRKEKELAEAAKICFKAAEASSSEDKPVSASEVISRPRSKLRQVPGLSIKSVKSSRNEASLNKLTEIEVSSSKDSSLVKTCLSQVQITAIPKLKRKSPPVVEKSESESDGESTKKKKCEEEEEDDSEDDESIFPSLFLDPSVTITVVENNDKKSETMQLSSDVSLTIIDKSKSEKSKTAPDKSKAASEKASVSVEKSTERSAERSSEKSSERNAEKAGVESNKHHSNTKSKARKSMPLPKQNLISVKNPSSMMANGNKTPPQPSTPNMQKDVQQAPTSRGPPTFPPPRAPHGVMPQLQPRPLSGHMATGPPVEAGPATSELHKHASKLSEYVRQSLESLMRDLSSLGSPQASVGAMQLEMERMQWRHQQELAELKHNADLVMLEMRASMEAERARAMSEVRRQSDMEKQRAVEETKKKQWCAFCNKEALFYCCWNTSYCDYPCQQAHWPRHMSTCAQKYSKDGNSSSPGSHAPKNSGYHSNPSEDGSSKRKRCGQCRGCLVTENCGVCAPCKNSRTHQVCRERRCTTLEEPEKWQNNPSTKKQQMKGLPPNVPLTQQQLINMNSGRPPQFAIVPRPMQGGGGMPQFAMYPAGSSPRAPLGSQTPHVAFPIQPHFFM